MSIAMAISMAVPFNTFAEDYLTRGEVCEMVMKAADDYNADVQKSDVMRGDSDGNLNEDKVATKLETFIMMNRAFGSYPELKGQNLRVAIKDVDYKDIPEWATEDMAPAITAGIADGEDENTFNSDAKVTKTDVQKYLRRVYAIYGTNLKDDFYSTANKNSLETATFFPGQMFGGTLYQMEEDTNNQLEAIIKSCVSSNPEKGSHQEKIKNYYENYLDMDARNSMDISVVQKYLDMAENMQNMTDFQKLYNALNDDFCYSFMGFNICIDDKNSNRYISYLSLPGTDLTQDAYAGKDENSKNVYIKYLEDLLKLTGEDEATAKSDVQTYFEIGKRISEKSLKPSERYELDKTYNIYTLEQISNEFKDLDIKQIFDISGLPNSEEILVDDVGAMKEWAKLFSDSEIEDLKVFTKINIIRFIEPYLGEEYIKLEDEFSKNFYGVSESTDNERKAINLVSATFDDYLGEMYADKYCTDEIKQDVKGMVEDIVKAYNKKIDNLDWMSQTTKEKAKRKLATMDIRVGAPDTFKDIYANADIKSKAEGGSYFQNDIEITKANVKYKIDIASKPVDKTEWDMQPFIINACYNPSNNSITFPMAFLQGIVYDVNFSYEEKLGGIGFVIGHEVSHAFDSSGSQYDEYGNAVDWWTAEDKQKFKELCNKVVDFYDDGEWAPGISNDGKLTLTENIADLGGMSCVIYLASEKEDFDYKKMFEQQCKFFDYIYTREAATVVGVSDSHSAGILRTNKVDQCMDKFYEAFGIQEGDGMYVPKEDRVSIW